MKKSVKLVVALAVCGLLTVAGTLAYLTKTTDTKHNVFTIGAGINGEILEPNWPDKEGNGVEYTPSATIKKDPLVHNTSEKESAYVGIKLEYKLTENAFNVYKENNKTTQYTSVEEVLTALGYANAEAYIKDITTLTFNTNAEGVASTTSEWFPAAGVENGYYYAEKGNASTLLSVASGAETNPLFGTVVISDDVTIEKMLPFEISATGYLVQTADITSADAITELSSLMNAVK